MFTSAIVLLTNILTRIYKDLAMLVLKLYLVPYTAIQLVPHICIIAHVHN